MSVKIEVFNTHEERVTRLKELREKGHNPDIYSDPICTKWETRYYLSYAPEMRKRRHGRAKKAS